MNNVLIQFAKSLMPPVLSVFAILMAVEIELLDLKPWREILHQAPMLLFVAAIVVALRFKQTRVLYPLLTMLLGWAMFVEVDNFKYLNFSSELWFLTQLLVLVVFSFDQNKTIWGRHGFIRILSLLLLVFINYRFNDSITIHQWLSTQYLGFLPQVSGIGQVELLCALGALFCLMFRQLTKENKVTLHTWVIVFYLMYFKLFDVEFNLQLLGQVIFGVLFIQAILADSYQMAFSDELTGIPARRALLQSSISLGKKYTVAMMDVDHFKKFNDTYGHDVGDQVLKLVASRLSQIKGGGKVYRYGGEEFTVIFPNKSVQYAIPYLEQVREAIANYQMTIRSEDRPEDTKEGKSMRKRNADGFEVVSVTISIGVAEREGELREFEQVLKQADEALYRAKESGRNCLAE